MNECNIHDLENIRDLLLKQREDIRKTLDFADAHSKIFKSQSDKLDELRIYYKLGEKGLNVLDSFIFNYFAYGENKISIIDYERED